MSERRIRYYLLAVLGLFTFIIAGLVVVIFDGRDALRALHQADWSLAAGALAVNIGALVFQSMSYVIINRMIKVDSGFANLFEVGLTSISISNVVSTPFGLSEHSIRSALLVPQGFKLGDLVAGSISHSYIKDMAILILAPVFILVQLVSGTDGRMILDTLVVMLFLSMGLLGLATALFVSLKVRSAALGFLNKIWHLVTKHSGQRQINDFNAAIELMKTRLRRHPKKTALLFLLMLGDWAFTLTVFRLCFLAMDVHIPLAVMISAFIVGKAAAILSLIPGGAGVRETSTAGVLALFGVDFSMAILIVVLFRVIYDFIPFMFSFVFLRTLFSRLRH